MRSLLVVALAAPVAAESFKVVERKDWVADWDKYVEKQAAAANGAILKYRSPAPTARREIMLREVYEADLKAGRRLAADSIGMLKQLLDAAPLKLKPLEVADFTVDDSQVRKIEITGDSVLAFWTIPHELIQKGAKRAASKLFLQGRNPGHSTVRITLGDGSVKLLQIDVP